MGILINYFKINPYFLLFWIAVFHHDSKGQIENNPEKSPSYYKEKRLVMEDFVYSSNIKTILFYPNTNELIQVLNYPVIALNQDVPLKLEFDDLGEEFLNYHAKLVHCDENWKPSVLSEHEFLEDFNLFPIVDYSNSFNTQHSYKHYFFTVPKVKITGNYLLKVFIENNEENLLLTRRFMIYEKDVIFNIQTKFSSDVGYRNQKQEIDFTLVIDPDKIKDAISSLKIIIRQNGRWDNAIYGLKPLFIRGNELIYNYNEENNFWGGNEFRNFDVRSLRYYTQYIDSIQQKRDFYNVFIKPSPLRSDKAYIYEKDINGNFVIQKQEATKPELEADYTYINFILQTNYMIPEGNFYIFGKLSDWKLQDEFLLKFNEEKRGYETKLFLKQGYYNYIYVLKPFSGDGKPDHTLTEGNFSVTENEYDIIVYYKPMGFRYDKIIGYQKIQYVP